MAEYRVFLNNGKDVWRVSAENHADAVRKVLPKHQIVEGEYGVGNVCVQGSRAVKYFMATPKEQRHTYTVTVACVGSVTIVASSETEAWEKANNLSRGAIAWADSFEITDIEEQDED